MGSLLPGWDQNIVVAEQIKEDENEHVPWWLKGNKEVVNMKDSEARRVSMDSGRRASFEHRERRRSAEHRRSFDLHDISFDINSDAEDAEVDDSGKVRLFWWKRLMSSDLNEKPDSNNISDYRYGSYQPQFNVAGDLAYSMPQPKNPANEFGLDDALIH